MIPRAVVAEVNDRAGDACEACGWPMHVGREYRALHHRKLRKHGGQDTAVNLMLVHHSCHNLHTNSIHNRVSRSHRLHHLVWSHEDPADTTPIVVSNLLHVVA